MGENDLQERLFRFAVDVLKMLGTLKRITLKTLLISPTTTK
jgi:hypothetical protein